MLHIPCRRIQRPYAAQHTTVDAGADHKVLHDQAGDVLLQRTLHQHVRGIGSLFAWRNESKEQPTFQDRIRRAVDGLAAVQDKDKLQENSNKVVYMNTMLLNTNVAAILTRRPGILHNL